MAIKEDIYIYKKQIGFLMILFIGGVHKWDLKKLIAYLKKIR